MTNALTTSRIGADPISPQLWALHTHNVTGPSAEVCVTGNSNPDFELFGGVAKGVK
ncbi:hypothetical protein D3C86_2192580 [compost metagenome]